MKLAAPLDIHADRPTPAAVFNTARGQEQDVGFMSIAAPMTSLTP